MPMLRAWSGWPGPTSASRRDSTESIIVSTRPIAASTGSKAELVELRQGMGALQTTLNRAGAGIILSLMGVIAAILAKGV